jgi:hypothetical protein
MTAKPIAPIAAVIAGADAFMRTGAISAFQCGPSPKTERVARNRGKGAAIQWRCQPVGYDEKSVSSGRSPKFLQTGGSVGMQTLSVIAGFLAAALWFWSACVRLPTTINSGWGGAGGTALVMTGSGV